MNNKYNKRVYAGYYKRYDGKLIYVITIAKDELSGEDTVIYTPYSLRNDDGYFTISKRDFCEPVKVDGKLKVRYKHQTQMRITDDFLEMLICDDLPAPKRKLPPKPDELSQEHIVSLVHITIMQKTFAQTISQIFEDIIILIQRTTFLKIPLMQKRL